MQTLDLHSGLLHQGMQCKSNIFFVIKYSITEDNGVGRFSILASIVIIFGILGGIFISLLLSYVTWLIFIVL